MRIFLHTFTWATRCGRAAFGLCLGVIAATASTSCANAPPPAMDARAGLDCVDDSPHCVRRRMATLDALTNDSSRAWIGERASARAYASGVRLFALRAKKAELSCSELKLARAEAGGAAAELSRGGAQLSPAQISRGKMLAAEVGRDLKREQAKRCGRR